MNTDISITSDRANIYSFLKQVELLCQPDSPAATKAFNLLYDVWEKVSLQLWNQGYWQDYSKCASVVLHGAKTVNKRNIEAQIANELGYFFMERGEYDLAQSYFTNSLNIAVAQQDLLRESQCLRYLGILRFRQGDFQEALGYFKQVQGIIEGLPASKFTEEKWSFYRAELLNLLGETHLKLEKFSSSLTYLKTSLQYYKELITMNFSRDYRYFCADPLLNIGLWYFLNSELEEAQSYYQQCLQLCREIKRTDTQASVLIALAQVAQLQNKLPEAVEYAEEAIAVAGKEHPLIRDEANHMLKNLKAFQMRQ